MQEVFFWKKRKISLFFHFSYWPLSW